MANFKKGTGRWDQYEGLPGEVERFDPSHRQGDGDYHRLRFHEKQDFWVEGTYEALKKAQSEGKDWLIVTHGHSTSEPFRTTARSVVRAIMRSKDSTPYVIKNQSIQHSSVFVARIRPLPEGGEDG